MFLFKATSSLEEKDCTVLLAVLCAVLLQASSDRPRYKELHKLYDNLLKERECVGVAFQNQQQEMEEYKLDESNKDAEELANLIQTKSEAIKTLQTKLAQAKKTITEL